MADFCVYRWMTPRGVSKPMLYPLSYEGTRDRGGALLVRNHGVVANLRGEG
jgi:hypothetical protein